MIIFKRLCVNKDPVYEFRALFDFLMRHILARDTFEVYKFFVQENTEMGAIRVSFLIKTSKRNDTK